MPDVPSLESLLANEPWIRGLARGLLADENAVDDVVQQALAAALERPPREAGKLRAWLGVVTRNAAREQHRRRATRDRREQAAATPEALPSAAQIAEREELRRQVVQAVLELDEPYRSTVLWRYFEELEPKAIAERTGTPAATVRTHLHRALAHLRARLDGLHGGDRRRWALALVPLAALGGSAQAAGVAGIGGATWAAAATVAVLAVGLAWWQPWRAASTNPAPPLETASVAGEPERPSAPVRAALPAAAPAPTPVAAPPAPAPPPVALPEQAITGRVLTGGGEPAGDVALGWLPRRLFEWTRDEGGPQQRGRAIPVNADGRWVVERPVRGGIALVLIPPTRWRLREPGGGRCVAEGESDVQIVVESLPRLRLRVLDAVTGLPVKDAAADGLASAPVADGIDVWMPADATYVRVIAPGYRPEAIEVAAPAGPEAVHPEPVRLVPDVELIGALADEAGQPIEQALVFVSPLDGRPLADDVELVAVTAAGGRYRVAGLRTGRFRVVARAMGRAAASAEIELAGPTTTRDLVLLPGDDGAVAGESWSTRSSMLVSVEFNDVPAVPALRWLAAAAGTSIDERELEPQDFDRLRVTIEVGAISLRDMVGLIAETCGLWLDPKAGAFRAR